MIKALLYNSCTSCRKAEQLLRQQGVEYEKRESFKERFTAGELRDLLRSVHLKPSEVISTRSRAYADRQLAQMDLTEDEIIDLMVEEPTLLRRPIVIKGDEAIVGYNESQLLELIDGNEADMAPTPRT